MGFIKIGQLNDVPNGAVKVYTIDDRDIAVCNVNGSIYAVDNFCSHDDAPLDQGELDGCEVECPRHGARFNVTNGEVAEGPAVLPLETFDVRVSGNDIEVKV